MQRFKGRSQDNYYWCFSAPISLEIESSSEEQLVQYHGIYYADVDPSSELILFRHLKFISDSKGTTNTTVTAGEKLKLEQHCKTNGAWSFTITSGRLPEFQPQKIYWDKSISEESDFREFRDHVAQRFREGIGIAA